MSSQRSSFLAESSTPRAFRGQFQPRKGRVRGDSSAHRVHRKSFGRNPSRENKQLPVRVVLVAPFLAGMRRYWPTRSSRQELGDLRNNLVASVFEQIVSGIFSDNRF